VRGYGVAAFHADQITHNATTIADTNILGFRRDMFVDDDLALLERQPATLDDTTTVDEASVAPRSEDDAGVWHQEAREVTESEVAVSPMVVDDSDW
tara:strand:+ start:1102 stop:1389 length:288 start_codon:yes stop_codon:yes gene_type:complete